MRAFHPGYGVLPRSSISVESNWRVCALCCNTDGQMQCSALVIPAIGSFPVKSAHLGKASIRRSVRSFGLISNEQALWWLTEFLLVFAKLSQLWDDRPHRTAFRTDVGGDK